MAALARERTLRRAAGVLVALSVLAGLAALAGGSEGGDGVPRAGASVQVYRGLATWVDIYDASAWADPAAAVDAMQGRGVRTLFLQTSNFSRNAAFVFPEGVTAFLDAAHARGLAVVAWYLPGFLHPDRDFRWARAAIRFRTPSGNAFDSFALDIESAKVRDPVTRTARLLQLSTRLRQTVGPGYPLGAIVPAPLGMQANPSYWPGFPYRQLASLYDAVLPMTYFTWRVSGPAAVASYTSGSIEAIRRGAGSSSVPIHVIGGIAGDATAAETAAFVRAALAGGAIGGSFYTYPLTTEGEWEALATLAGSAVVQSPTG